MAKTKTDEKDEAEQDEAEASAGADESESSESESSEEDAADERSSGEAEESDSAKDGDEGAADADEGSADEDADEGASKKTADKELSAALAKKAVSAEEVDEEEEAAAQLGTQRYVLAAFFAAGILSAYVLGKLIHGVWSWASNKDWFHSNLSFLAAVSDDDKTTWGTVLGAVIAVIAVIRTYRKESVRAWAKEVASELAKVKWPTRKEVTNSTVVVIAASAVATLYLALLDRLWSFVTDLFYGTGS